MDSIAAESLDYIDARPANGEVIHAVRPVWAYPSSARSTFRGSLIFGRALCGVRGRDGWGGGGMRAVIEAGDAVRFDVERGTGGHPGYDGRTYNIVCPRCIAKVKRERKAAA
jgi:hypothetical protein